MPTSGRIVDVLLVEDDPAHAELAMRAFRRVTERFHLQVVSDLRGARERMAGARVHLVIADLFLPDGRCTELLRGKREHPLVVLTSQGDEQQAVSAIKSGAIDYVVKTPTTLADLPRIAERALREWRGAAGRAEERERYETILGATSDIITQIDAEGRCSWVNRAGVAFFGEGASGRIEGELDETVKKTLLYGDLQELYVERRTRRCDGAERLLAWWHRALHDPTHGRVGLLCTARDITEARRLERELQHAHKFEALGHLAASIAHDFNNVLMGISSCADVALASLDSGSVAFDDVRELKREALSGASLTRQLLSFARKQDVDFSVVDLCSVVGGVEPMMRRLVGPDVRLEVECRGGATLVRADRGQIEQFLLNLVVNARDAMPSGGDVRIAIEGDDANVFLSVTDTGVGMDDETLGHAFEPYYTTKPASSGTGLGLSTVYGIVRQHGGDVHLHSQPGGGTSVLIRLPKADGVVEERHSEGPTESFPPRAATVLVVDDHATTREAMKRLLEGCAYDVLVASSGAEAIRRCLGHDGPIHLVLADLRLPDARGTDLVERVRQIKEPAGVIFISGMAPDDPEVVEHLEASDTTFLAKPVDFERLEREMRRILATSLGRSS